MNMEIAKDKTQLVKYSFYSNYNIGDKVYLNVRDGESVTITNILYNTRDNITEYETINQTGDLNIYPYSALSPNIVF